MNPLFHQPSTINKMKTTETVNMNRQYRDELKTLKRAARIVKKDWRIKKKTSERLMKSISRDLQRTSKTVARELQRIEKRSAILQGRLS